VITTVYRLALRHSQYLFLRRLKHRSGVPINRQLDYAIDLLHSTYSSNPDAVIEDLDYYKEHRKPPGTPPLTADDLAEALATLPEFQHQKPRHSRKSHHKVT